MGQYKNFLLGHLLGNHLRHISFNYLSSVPLTTIKNATMKQIAKEILVHKKLLGYNLANLNVKEELRLKHSMGCR